MVNHQHPTRYDSHISFLKLLFYLFYPINKKLNKTSLHMYYYTSKQQMTLTVSNLRTIGNTLIELFVAFVITKPSNRHNNRNSLRVGIIDPYVSSIDPFSLLSLNESSTPFGTGNYQLTSEPPVPIDIRSPWNIQHSIGIRTNEPVIGNDDYPESYMSDVD